MMMRPDRLGFMWRAAARTVANTPFILTSITRFPALVGIVFEAPSGTRGLSDPAQPR